MSVAGENGRPQEYWECACVNGCLTVGTQGSSCECTLHHVYVTVVVCMSFMLVINICWICVKETIVNEYIIHSICVS